LSFQKEEIIPLDIYQRITDIRVDNPDFIIDWSNRRVKSKQFTRNGKLNVVAADHPARGSVSVGNKSFEMADRHELLSRLVDVLYSEWVDGILGSMDILEELIILHGLFIESGKPGFLDGKILIASLNRGGFPGAAWEMDDPITGTDAATCLKYGFDAAKMLLRLDPDDEKSLQTILHCAEGVRDFDAHKLPIFLEPLPVKKENNFYKVIKDPDLLIPLVTMTSALGSSSKYSWLKLPFTKDFSRVAASTTLPIVILGGDRTDSIDGLILDLKEALAAGHQVRGAMFGRNVLYPLDQSPREVANKIGKFIHQSA
jgi:hypothetical protein